MHLLLPYFWTNAKTGESFDISSFESYTNTSNIVQFIAIKNPFRYRSYYYDFETGLYYLNSRYYDPEIGRFINADDINILENTKDVINGLNIYSYCLNNPINCSDNDGDIPNWLKWLIGALIIIVAVAVTVISAGVAGIGIGAAFAGALGFGASVGGFTGFVAAVTVGAITGATIGLLGGGFSSLASGGSFIDGAADGFMWGSISGAISGGIGSFKFGGIGNFGPKGKGNVFQVGLQTLVSLGSYISKSFANGEKLTAFGIISALFGGVSGGLLNSAPILTQLFVSGGVEIINALVEVLKKLWKVPKNNYILSIAKN